jgi:hypothetical protein
VLYAAVSRNGSGPVAIGLIAMCSATDETNRGGRTASA